eukprot:GFYU01012662.1.p1 GENE.GFYU01012662.1~~GFYU01012662.1.p1  ORF type:complete len:257 (+),score=56.29 GFYU01012662.1:47-817(+)
MSTNWEIQLSKKAGEKDRRPRKKDFRMRAHCNPLADPLFDYPMDPSQVNWKEMFPRWKDAGPGCVQFMDIGCGYGGLTVALAKQCPDKVILAMEIRDKVTQYVQQRLEDLQNKCPGEYGNAAAIRTNAMKYLPNYVYKGQIEKIFICFPDPHFKKANHRRRIVSNVMLAEYGYAMKDNGLIYTITDVEDLHKWMVSHLDAHPSFERLPVEEMEADPLTPLVRTTTEEGIKVERNSGKKFMAIHRRIPRAECIAASN